MRQVFLGSPWIHAPADPDIVRLFNTCGRWAKLPAGGCIFNGGDRGEIALVLSGLGAFSFQDRHGRNHIFTLILPGRLMGDVDGLSGSTVNVTDAALRETEVRLLSRDLFLQFLSENPSIQRKHAVGIIADHESDMEGMIANFTLSAPDRIITLFASLIHNLRPEPDSEGFYPLENSLTTIEISQIVSVARNCIPFRSRIASFHPFSETSRLMLITCKLSRNFSANSSNSGCAIKQGPHPRLQKSNKIYFPR